MGNWAGNGTAVVAVLWALLGLPLFAAAQDRLVRFEGGIGVVPVRPDGRISVDGRGLLLGGGNNIGTNGGQQVRARLFCGQGNGVPFDSALVALNDDGDFRIEGQLTGLLLSQCERPVLLIINSGGVWFAAGIPKL